MSTKTEATTMDQVKNIHSELTRLIRSEHSQLLSLYRLKLGVYIDMAKIKLEELQDTRFVDAEKKTLEFELEKANTELNKLRDPVIQEYRKKTLEIALEKANNNYATLKDNEITLKAKYQSLDTAKQLIESQISELKKQLKETVVLLQLKSTEITNDSNQAMAILMLGNAVQQNRNRLSSLEERLYVDLDNERIEIQHLMEENKRMQSHQAKIIEEKRTNTEKYWIENKLDQAQKLAKINNITAQIKKLAAVQEQAIKRRKQALSALEGELSNLVDTQIITPPVDPSKVTPRASTMMILVLSIMLGLMLALFSIFIAEFLEKVRAIERSAYSS